MAGEEPRNVLEEDRGRSVEGHKVKEGEGEDGSGAGEPGSLARNAEVLARKTAGPEGSPSPLPTLSGGLESSLASRPLLPPVELNTVGSGWNSTCPFPVASVRLSSTASSGPLPPPGFPSRIVSKTGDVAELGDSWPPLREDGTGVGVDLAEADGSPSGSGQPHVKASDSAEERGVRELMRHGSPAPLGCRRPPGGPRGRPPVRPPAGRTP